MVAAMLDLPENTLKTKLVRIWCIPFLTFLLFQKDMPFFAPISYTTFCYIPHYL
jgi:hypothetical protein